MPDQNKRSLWSRFFRRFDARDVLLRLPPPLLIDRGFGLIYDTERNITWLQDANYAKTVRRSRDGQLTWRRDGVGQFAELPRGARLAFADGVR